MLEPEEVESWNFPNPACNSLTVEDKLVRAFRSRVRRDADTVGLK